MTNAAANTAPTATCPCCHRAMKLDAQGRMSRHGQKRSRSGSTGYCMGSGRSVEAARVRNLNAMLTELHRLEDVRSAMVDAGKTVRRVTSKIDALQAKYLAALEA